MAKKAGICRNIDCDNYKQVIEIEAGEEFECPLCHQPLEDAGSKGSKGSKKKDGGGGVNGKLIGIILGAIILLGGIGFGVYTLVNNLSGNSMPTAIKLAKSKITMKVGETIVLTPKVEPEGAKATFTFKPKKDSKSLIKVNNGGEVTALKAGKAVILIKCEENQKIKKYCRITIVEDTAKDDSSKTKPEDTLIQKITIQESSITMITGEKKELSVIIEPENFNEQILVSSSDENVAELVISEGKVVAKKAGTAIITLRGEKSSVSASVKVTVNDKPTTTGGGGRTNGGGSKTTTKSGGNGYGTVKLSYGTYRGEVKNGQPHGHGTVTFTTTHRIVSSQDYIAHPGDRYEGEWRNGVISGGLGYWYHDGNTTGIRP